VSKPEGNQWKKNSKYVHLTKHFYGKGTIDKKISGHVAGLGRVRKSLNLCSEIHLGG
jgi:hypothetical protein